MGAESRWLRIGYGDSYPFSFPDLILSGKRVRGLHASLMLGVFNVDMTLGETVRRVEGVLLKTFPDSLLSQEQTSDPRRCLRASTRRRLGEIPVRYVRVGICLPYAQASARARHFRFGLTWMKSKDDMSSIVYGFSPEENLVVGADIISRFDDNRIEFSGQAAFSAHNSDISGGNISNERIGQLFPNPKDSSDVVDVRDIAVESDHRERKSASAQLRTGSPPPRTTLLCGSTTSTTCSSSPISSGGTTTLVWPILPA